MRVLLCKRWAQPESLRDAELSDVVEVQSGLDLVSGAVHRMTRGRSVRAHLHARELREQAVGHLVRRRRRGRNAQQRHHRCAEARTDAL